ncbi:LysR substrate-binding domain-containing protein [Pannonibacter tanglangensis]|uniref:LysR family transcriptional regulator n=1 Tax=Pannonibacter tanglangensis TaxID=2750084 RepID=A0ABW9ZFI3_9HYPH|nr:LysR substrate-binding domain-containing protein [Pannonibacter sp. XCT-34]NBN63608.1 LysR family transcriptional regulator [Pannonibacter sp. XCT-34]
MKPRLTSLPSLACFRVAAELESFSKAADRLHLTHGAVSRAVRLLEDDVGTALFERRNRAVFLTEEGRLLADAVARGLDQIEAAIRQIRDAHKAGVVTVSCEPTLLMRWLIPRMARFQEANPEADVRLIAAGGPVNLGKGIDLAIRRTDFDLPRSYAVHSLFAERIGPVCRPDRIDRFFEDGALRPDAPRLHTRTRASAWSAWTALSGASDQTAQAGQVYEHFYFSLQAAVAGTGVAIGPWHLVRDDLQSGLLAAPLGFVPDGSSYVLLEPEAERASPTAVAFRNWLVAVAVEDPAEEAVRPV